jgi:hypothetical protein
MEQPKHRRKVITNKFFGFTLSALLFALCSSALAQQTQKIPRIGFLPSSGDTNNPGIEVRAFQQRLRDLGYIEGKSILLSIATRRERQTVSQAL